MNTEVDSLIAICRKALVKIQDKDIEGVAISPEEVVEYTLNSSVPKDAPPFIRRVLSADVKGQGRNTVIMAKVEMFDGATGVYELIVDPAFGGWGYMYKSGGQFSYNRADRC